MSDQDMEFADPDWKPTTPLAGNNGARGKQEPATSGSAEPFRPRPINEDWRKQAQAPGVDTAAEPRQRGYDGLPPYGGYPGSMPGQQPPYQYQQSGYRRRRRGPWLWIILVILLFSLLGGGFGSLGSVGQKSLIENQTFNVNGTPTIVLHESNGNVRVQQGSPGSSVNIQANKQTGFFDDPNNIQVNIRPQGNTINVDVNTGSGFLSQRSVDFTITVPQAVNLDLQTNSGDINVDNITGQATLSTNSGDISASNDTFSSGSSLQTTSGDIKTAQDGFGGNSTVSTTSGDISLDQDTLQGSEKFNTTSGNIDFHGSVDPAGSYQFNAASGDINIGLQPSTSFSVNAQTTSGSIQSNDFPAIQVQDNNQGPGSTASGSVGTSPFAQFTLVTTSGDITIQHG